jgi:C1A family cysteine protease
MVPRIFASAKNIAKNILTIVVSLGVIHSFTWAAEQDEQASPPFSLSLQQKQVDVLDASSPLTSPRHRYQLIIPSETRASYQWVLAHETPKKFRTSLTSSILAPQVDFSSEIPCIREQGDLGTCTAMSMVISLEYYYSKIKEQTMKFSPLFVYYNERLLTHTIEEDIGASLTDAILAITVFGACQETTWPYIDDKIKFKEKPSVEAYSEPREIFKGWSFKHTKLSNDVALIKHFLSQKNPVLCGINVFPSLETEETEKTGIIPMPSHHEIPIGAHAITLVGYDDTTQRFKFANSWGRQWGENGFGYVSYDYIANNNPQNLFLHTHPGEVWRIKLA